MNLELGIRNLECAPSSQTHSKFRFYVFIHRKASARTSGGSSCRPSNSR
jgi:hypothetical protein